MTAKDSPPRAEPSSRLGQLKPSSAPRGACPKRLSLLLGCCALLLTAGAQAIPTETELVFAVPTNLSFPLVEFDANVLTRGIVKEVGEAIAGKLHRRARFLALPAKRIAGALSSGQADGVCYSAPEWMASGDFSWSRPLLATARVVAGHAQSRQLAGIAALDGELVGTQLGYRYAELDAALGPRFLRSDAVNDETLLGKLAARRVNYAVTDEISIARFNLRHPGAQIRVVLPLTQLMTRCAFSKSSSVPLHELNQAIDALMSGGVVERILENFAASGLVMAGGMPAKK